MANSTDLFQPTLCKLAKVHSQQVSYLKAQEAGGVVIVSAIKRAANEKVAQDMLGERFRRQLLMDGHYGGYLAFVATCTDELTLSELRRTFLELSLEKIVSRQSLWKWNLG